MAICGADSASAKQQIRNEVDVMGVKEAFLIIDDSTIATFESDKYYDMVLSGEFKTVQSWNEDGSPWETDFFMRGGIKWDGCSNLYFTGEDGDNDSYYHLCGISYYINHMRVLAFAYELMVKHVGKNEILEAGELKELRSLGLLDGCEIRYTDYKGNDHTVDCDKLIK